VVRVADRDHGRVRQQLGDGGDRRLGDHDDTRARHHGLGRPQKEHRRQVAAQGGVLLVVGQHREGAVGRRLRGLGPDAARGQLHRVEGEDVVDESGRPDERRRPPRLEVRIEVRVHLVETRERGLDHLGRVESALRRRQHAAVDHHGSTDSAAVLPHEGRGDEGAHGVTHEDGRRDVQFVKELLEVTGVVVQGEARLGLAAVAATADVDGEDRVVATQPLGEQVPPVTVGRDAVDAHDRAFAPAGPAHVVQGDIVADLHVPVPEP